MAAYMFHILKMNFIAAVMIFAAMILAQITKRKYSLKWKYFMWLAIMIFLLVPVNFSAKSPVKVQINQAVPGGQPEKLIRRTARAEDFSGERESVLSAERKEDRIELSSEKISLYRVLQILAGIWIAGIVFFGVIRSLRYYFSLHSVRRWSYPTDDTKLLGLYFRVCKKKHIRKPPRLLICAGLPSPMLAGLKSTGLYIPEDDYSEKELEFIFSHELSHYLRHDLWYKMLMIAVTTVYWFNPMLYWMQREAERDIENLCDGKMAAHYTIAERKKYGELLLRFAASQSHVPYLAVNLNNSKRVFRDRILYMRNLKFLKEKLMPAVILSAVMVMSHLLVGSSIGSLPVQAGDLVDFQPVEKKNDDSADADVGVDLPDGEADAELKEAVNMQTDTESMAADKMESAENGQENRKPTETPEPTSVPEQSYEVENAGFSGWVWSEQLNVRSGCSEDASVVGTLYFADAVYITGIVKRSDGEQWYRIDYDGGEAYISANHASEVPPTPYSFGIDMTDEQRMLWCLEDNRQNSITKATDGNWYDGSSRPFVQDESGNWILTTEGTTWSETDPHPETPADSAVDEVNIADEEALNFGTIYLGEDGVWRNIANGIFTENGDGTFTGMDGTVWYTYTTE